jgi:hypothetical protein
MMANPAKPWVERFILQQCYVRNSPKAQQRFRGMSAKQMHRVIKE